MIGDKVHYPWIPPLTNRRQKSFRPCVMAVDRDNRILRGWKWAPNSRERLRSGYGPVPADPLGVTGEAQGRFVNLRVGDAETDT